MSNLILGVFGYIAGSALLVAALFIDEGTTTIVAAIIGATCLIMATIVGATDAISTHIEDVKWQLEKRNMWEAVKDE